MRKWGDGDDSGEPETAMDMVAALSSLNAEVLRRIRENEFYDAILSQATVIVRALSAIPADAAERLADAERRVEKMRHALALIQSGVLDVSGFPQTVKDASLNAIKEALE